MKRVILYSFIIVMTTLACTKVIDIDFPAHESKPVVNSFIGADSIIQVHVNTSVPVLEPDTIFPDDALVLLYKDNTPRDTLTFQSNRYMSDYTGEIGCEYAVKVLIPGYDTVFSETKVPERPQIYDLSHKHDIIIDQDRIHYSQLKFTIRDSDPEVNYYEFDIIEKYSSEYTPEDTTYGFTWLGNNVDPVLEDEGLLDYNPPTMVFTDRLFNGSDYTMTINYTSPNNHTDSYDVILKFNSVSSDYYYYKRKLAIFTSTLYADVFFGGPEPVELYSNIKGGYGIFASYTSSEYVIHVNEEE
ncbi:MAG: DUF4249 domain-containing protein [Bacteroidales bacterium]